MDQPSILLAIAFFHFSFEQFNWDKEMLLTAQIEFS